MEQDYYAMLGVPPNATQEDIQAAYRRRAKEFHPDQNPHHAEWADTQFKRLNEAYRTLIDEDQRRVYDQQRWQEQVRQKRAARDTAPPPPTTPPTPKPNSPAIWLWTIPLMLVAILLVLGLFIAALLDTDTDTENTRDIFVPADKPPINIEPSTRAALQNVTTNADWTPHLQTVEGFEMALVPPGCFVAGPPPASSTERTAQERCFTEPFWIDRYEVSNAAYIDYLQSATEDDAMRCQSEWCADDHPRDSIAWEDAMRFCSLRGGRLPTNDEWAYAGRGPDSLLYPWGDSFVPEYVIYRDVFTAPDGSAQRPETRAVDARPQNVSWVGAEQMVGNVREWVLDDASAATPAQRLRGGAAFQNSPSLLTNDLSGSGQLGGGTVSVYNGFRCIRER
ncbi:MAG: SUMF1/EgtB/PvdO family nonheme iron enzyme [Anaerolineales bacterium]